MPKSSVADPGSGAFSNPGSGIREWVKNQNLGRTTRIIFPRAQKQLFGLKKYSDSLMRIRDPGWKNSNPGSGMENIPIRDKHPGSYRKETAKKMKHIRPTVVRKHARYLTYICMCNLLHHYKKEIKKECLQKVCWHAMKEI
jgi:hypothetical protein